MTKIWQSCEDFTTILWSFYNVL